MNFIAILYCLQGRTCSPTAVISLTWCKPNCCRCMILCPSRHLRTLPHQLVWYVRSRFKKLLFTSFALGFASFPFCSPFRFLCLCFWQRRLGQQARLHQSLSHDHHPHHYRHKASIDGCNARFCAKLMPQPLKLMTRLDTEMLTLESCGEEEQTSSECNFSNFFSIDKEGACGYWSASRVVCCVSGRYLVGWGNLRQCSLRIPWT